MNKAGKILALSVGSLMAFATLAACKKTEEPPIDDNQAFGNVSWAASICYDNLPSDGISIDAADTKVTIEGGATNIKGYSASGNEVDASAVATYDEATKTFTAVGRGSVKFTMSDNKTGRVDVLPAYTVDPGEDWHYTGNRTVDMNEESSVLLGNTHDPSLIEVQENGKSVYYMVSTGWDTKSDFEGITTYGNPIHRSEDLLTWEFVGRTFDWEDRDDDFVNNDAGDWLYGVSEGGSTSGFSVAKSSWWAPDIVPAAGGGYWLYTCVVDGSSDSQGVSLPGKAGRFARACILLYYSDRIEAGTFKPVTDADGKQVVLMQSSIMRGESVKDVNGIDPQIIYTPDGKMYMAYGSFGSGNYMIELDPATGLRKDGKGWQTHTDIRRFVEEDIQPEFNASMQSVGWTHDYYGVNISKENMEAPVIARHDNVVISDEEGTVLSEAKTYYYSMHSYNGLGDDYQMWGGRSESVTGIYKSGMGGGIVHNVNSNSGNNQGNKYMGAFRWDNKSAGNTEIDPILTGHNDLFSTMSGTHIAAYITRTPSYNATSSSIAGNTFFVQIHQYYLNSMGDLVINANRYAGEADRSVSKEELLEYTENGKFKMIVMANHRDTASGSQLNNISNVSRDVVLTENGKITEANGTEIGEWVMYGKGYIKFKFNENLRGTNNVDSGETVYYGVVRPAWLGDQDKSGFTITCMGHSNNVRSMAMYMNNYSTIEL